MSRTSNSIGVVNFHGQPFHTKVGKVIGKPTWFSSDSRKVVNRLTGEISELEESKRIIISVMNEGGFENLDPISFEQLSLATGKVITEQDLIVLRNADIMYYVSERKAGEDYYFRPDNQSDNNKQVAQRSGEFTTLFKVVPAEQYIEKYEALPEYAGHAKFTSDDEKAVKAQSELIKREAKESGKENDRNETDDSGESGTEPKSSGAKSKTTAK